MAGLVEQVQVLRSLAHSHGKRTEAGMISLDTTTATEFLPTGPASRFISCAGVKP